MEQKSIVFIVVALVVGAALGAGIGMMLSGDESNGEETYWYCLYFADGDERNDWYKGTGTDATKAFGSLPAHLLHPVFCQWGRQALPGYPDGAFL